MLVQIGYFLILPGVVLEFAPTAFIWGSIYAGMRRMIGTRCADRLAVVASLACTAAILVLVPSLMQVETEVRLTLATVPDVQPAQRIVLAGNVRIETNDSAYYPLSCDIKCVATLLTPGVRSVTVASTADAPDARPPVRFRLVARGQCGNQEDQPGLPAPADWQWGKQRLAGRGCLLAEPVDTAPDFTIHAVSRPGSRAGGWSPWPGLQVEEGIITQGRTVLVRRSQVGVDAWTAPLRIVGSGGFSHYSFGWATKRLGVERAAIMPVNPYAMTANQTSVAFPHR